MLRNQQTAHTRRRWILAIIVGLGLAAVPSIRAFAYDPYIEIWSESYGGYWTASTSLDTVAAKITHSAEIYSSIDEVDPNYISDDSTDYFFTQVPIHIDCVDTDELVTTVTDHDVWVDSPATGPAPYSEESGEQLDCGSVNAF